MASFLRRLRLYLTSGLILRGAVAALAGVTFVACATDSAVAPDSTKDVASVRISASVAGTSINVLVITVSGDGIPTPLVFNLAVNNNFASGELKVPAGNARLFSVQAFDSNGEVTHDGSKVVDVKRGPNPPISIPLAPRNGQQPISVTMGDYSINITSPTQTVAVGGSVQLTAEVRAPNGDIVTPTVAWATSDPSIATVDGGGLVVGHRGGSTQIVATYGGVLGSTTIIVSDASAPLVYQGPVFPGPTGVTLVNYLGANGGLGRAGGRTFDYTGFNFNTARFIALGVNSNDMPAVDFTGGTAQDPIAPSTRMTTLATDNLDIANGKLSYSGVTTLPMANGPAITLPTRVTIVYSATVGGVEIPVPLQAAQGAAAPTIQGWAPIAPSWASSTVHAKVLLEVQNGTSWVPALDYFDSNTDKATGTASRISFAGAVYYSF